MRRYNPKEIEPKWQKHWADNKVFHVVEDAKKPKSYVIDMFPYPSGAGLHVGHVRNFTISDTIAQYQRQKGKNVLHAMGWDEFGLPAENYAIKTGVPPQKSIATNVNNFKTQLRKLGMSYDWSRAVHTANPNYYKWTQWIFTQLFEKGLAYQAESLQWWCPVDKTVLANEQVEAGKCWRCGTEVEKKALKQWFFKITEYAEELLAGIDTLSWPDKIKTMQKNWIGRSVGVKIKFQVTRSTSSGQASSKKQEIEVFTTRPDTLYGATFLVLAPEHPLVGKLTFEGEKPKVDSYIKEASAKSDVQRQETEREKIGVFTGSYAINPANDEKIPIWIADYVLPGHGTGAIMAVPAHDQRDWEFAKKYDLPITRVIKNDEPDEAYTESEGALINSGWLDGMESSEAREKITKWLEKEKTGKEVTNYKMRDWLISRQRYWGAPIPIIHCPKDGAVAVPEKALPVKLPEIKSYEPSGDGRSPLAGVEQFVNAKCPKCGEPAKRETDTMDGYACSSWYYLRYTDANNDKQAWDKAKADYWMPIDYYCGGDHAVSHLLYSRFWMYFFADQGLISKTRKEPVGRLVYNGYINAPDGAKMSKSKGNVINPDELIDQGYGADALRLFELFVGPYEQDVVWNTNGVVGAFRFLQRAWTLAQEFQDSKDKKALGQQEILKAIHKTIYHASKDLENLNFNTAIASLMEYVNDLYKIKAKHGYGAKKEWEFALNSLTQLLAPFAPHVSEELWQELGHKGSVHFSGWPVHDEKYLISDTMIIVAQVNGRVRANLTMPADASEEEIKKAAAKDSKITPYLKDNKILKTIYVPRKLVNFVIKD